MIIKVFRMIIMMVRMIMTMTAMTMTITISAKHCLPYFLVMKMMIMITMTMPINIKVIVVMLLGIHLDGHEDNVYGDVDDDDDDAPLLMTRMMVVRVIVSISPLYSLYNIESSSCPPWSLPSKKTTLIIIIILSTYPFGLFLSWEETNLLKLICSSISPSPSLKSHLSKVYF